MSLVVDNLHFSYKNHEVLKGVTFEAKRGESVFILGANGSGKTTLFKCLLRLIKAQKGTISIDGKSLNQLSNLEIAKNIAYIPQAHTPSFNFSVFQVVLMGTTSSVSGISFPKEKEKLRAKEALELLGIWHLSQRGYSNLSGGERQLVLIARALAQQSKILIMDEPASFLDYGNQLRVLNEVKSLSELGYLVLISIHNPEQALLYADKVLVLQKGIVSHFGKTLDVLKPKTIQDIYNIDVGISNIETEQGEIPIIYPLVKK